jgi:NAD(P)-dependent dehydrogenase (short-subunit alcohol dehydrogenase family)
MLAYVSSPCPVETPGLNKSFSGSGRSEEEIKTNLAASVPMGRMGNPIEIAKAVLSLASGDSSFVTGIELIVEGGITQIRINIISNHAGLIAFIT